MTRSSRDVATKPTDHVDRSRAHSSKGSCRKIETEHNSLNDFPMNKVNRCPLLLLLRTTSLSS